MQPQARGPQGKAAALAERFSQHVATIGVVGLGYVGIPLALAAARAGFAVLGFDINARRIEQITGGDGVLKHIPDSDVRAAVDSGRLRATADFTRLDEPDAVLICVPTPLTRHREPDLSYVVRTTEMIAARLRADQLIVLESTTYPGTTNEIVKPILERTGLRSGIDFFLAFSPEREDPGNPHYGISTIPKVIGGDGPDALAL